MTSKQLGMCLLLTDYGVDVQAGLDSLGSVELRNALATKFAISIPATATFDYPTAAALAAYVAGMVAPAQPAHLVPSAATATTLADLAAPVTTTLVVAASALYPMAESEGMISTSQPTKPCDQHPPHPAGVSTISEANADACWSWRACSGMLGFWRNLQQGRNVPTVTPLQRWEVEAYYAPDAGRDHIYARVAAHLGNIQSFDAALFRLSTAEAVSLDPHARMLLEDTLVSKMNRRLSSSIVCNDAC